MPLKYSKVFLSCEWKFSPNVFVAIRILCEWVRRISILKNAFLIEKSLRGLRLVSKYGVRLPLICLLKLNKKLEFNWKLR